MRILFHFSLLPPQEEFLKTNPNGINPVNSNDVFFSIHALLLCAVYVCQAVVYEVGVICKRLRVMGQGLVQQHVFLSCRGGTKRSPGWQSSCC